MIVLVQVLRYLCLSAADLVFTMDDALGQEWPTQFVQNVHRAVGVPHIEMRRLADFQYAKIVFAAQSTRCVYSDALPSFKRR